MIETRDGVVSVPRMQAGTPLREYLRNTQLPDDLPGSVVYETAVGPVALAPDPIPWNETHDQRVRQHAEQLQRQIDKWIKYRPMLDSFSKRLSEETPVLKSDVAARIAAQFHENTGLSLFGYQREVRMERGLDRQSNQRDLSQEPEM